MTPGRPDAVLVRLDLDGVRTALGWAEREGWNPGHHDAEAFFAADPGGFLGLEVDGVLAVTASVVRYDEDFAFGGLFIANPAWRGEGLGARLLEEALAFAGDRTIGIDAVLEQEDRYARDGFVADSTTTRWALTPKAAPAPANATVDARTVPIDLLVDFERRCFPAPRAAFLQAWLAMPGATARAVVTTDGSVRAWGLLRPCVEGAKVGPLFADDPDAAEAVWRDLTAGAAGPVVVDVPEPNGAARALVARYAMSPVFTTRRMYRGPAPALDLDRVFGVTTLELG